MKFKSNIEVQAGIEDKDGQVGSSGQILASTGSQVDWVDPANIVTSATDVIIECKNTSGVTIAKGTPVYQTGNVGATAVIEVAVADASDEDKMAAIGLLQSDLINNAFGYVVVTGELLNITTSPIDGVTPTTGDTIYVKPGGGLTLTKPTGVNFIQNVGLVGKVSGGNAGSITVSSIMRSNDVPTPLYIDHDNQRLGIGATSPSDKLDVQDGYIRVGFTGGAQFKLVPHSSNDGYGFYDVVNTNYDMWFDGGKVGIGTTSPVGKFEVQTEDSNRYIRFKAPNGEERFEFYTGGTGNASRLSMYADDGTTEGTRIHSAGKSWFNGGNVGIGTTSPGEKLEVDGIIKVVHTDNSYANYRGQGVFFNRTENYLAPLADNTSTLNIGYNGAKWGNIEINGAFIKFENGPNEFMRIASSGNVGIGTTSPSNPLHVSSSDNILATFESTDAISEIRIKDNTKYTRLLTVGSDFKIMPNDGVEMAVFEGDTGRTLFNAGNVGIGTTSPGAKLDISTTGTGDSMIIRNDDASSSAAPVFVLKRDSSSPANGDYLGQLKFKGENDAGQEIVYAKITAKISDVTDGAEDGLIETAVKSGGSNLIVSRQTGTDLKLINGVGLEVDGDATFASNVSLADSKKLILGTGSDLQIYHDGSNSYINDTDTGDLYIQASDNMYFQTYGSGKRWITLNENASVDLFYNDSKKFETTNTGVTITGGWVTDGVSVATANVEHTDNTKALFGNGNDLQIYHDGNDSYIKDSGTGDLRIDTSKFRVRSAGGTESMIIATENGSVDLYYNDLKKFETQSSGVSVSGGLTVSGTNSFLIESNSTAATFNLNSSVRGFDFINNNGTLLNLDSAGNGTFADQAFATTATSSGDASSTLTTKGYVDGLITGATIYRGAWDPSGGGYGSPDLSGVTQTSGYYYICSAAGTAEPNGTGTEPDTWETGDWVIYNDVSGTGQWQKIDNSSVLSGVGTGQTVALWEGAGSVTDSETLGNAPITVSGNDTTFAGSVTVGTKLMITSSSDYIDVISDDLYIVAADKNILYSGNAETLRLDESQNATFAGAVSTGGYLTLNSSDSIPRLIFNGSGDDFFFSNTASYFGLYNSTDSRWDIKVDGAGDTTFAGDVSLADNKKLTFGAAPDFEIYHNSTTNVNHISSLLSRQLSISADTTTFSGDVTANANYTAGNSKIIYKAQRSGGAVAGDWSYDDATTDMSLGTSTAHSFSLKTGNTRALTINSSQNATFAGSVLASGYLAGQSSQYNPTGGGTTLATLTNNSASRTNLVISNQTNNAAASAALVLATYGHDYFIKGSSLAGGSQLTLGFNTSNFLTLTSSAATFAGAVTVEGGILHLGKADTASGHINAKELMTFNIDTDNDDTNRYFAWYTNSESGSGTELLKIEEDGNATFAGDVLVEDNLYLTDAGTVRGKIQLNSSDRDDLDIKAVSLGSNMKFFTVNTERMRIDGSGNVGIGTDSPNAKLHIQGINSTNGGIRLHNAGGNPYSIWSDNDKLYFSQGNGSTTALAIAYGGNVGIGTTTPDSKLHVAGGTRLGGGGCYISTDASFSTNFSYTFRDAVGINNPNSVSAPSVAGYVMSVGRSISGGVGGGIYVEGESRFARGLAGVIKFNAYDGTNNTGSPTHILGTDASGNVVKSTAGSSIGPWLPLAGGTMTGVTQFNDHTQHGDQVLAKWGASNDLTIQHNGTNSGIANSVGNLYISNHADDKDIIFESDNGSGASVSYLTLDGSTTHAYFSNPGNVGIGTTSPDGKLDVAQNMTAGTTTAFTSPHLSLTALNATDNTGFVGMTFATSDNVNYGWSWGALRTNGGLGDMVLRNHYNSAQGTEKMRILANGNVGIGEDSPDAKLEVEGSYGDVIKAVSGSQNITTNFVAPSTGSGLNNIISTAGKFNIGTSDAQPFNLTTNSISRVAILSDGKVGIGTTSPVVNLDVRTSTSDTIALFVNNGINDKQLAIEGLSDRLQLKVRNHTATPATADTDMSFNSGTSETMRITSVGDVGIGTTSPDEKLEVVGNIKIDNALLSNKRNTDIDSGAAEVVAQVSITYYKAAFFDYVVKKGTNVRAGIVSACHDGTNVEFIETSTQDLGDTSDVALSVDISGTDLRLIATVASDDWSVTTLIRAI